MPAFNPSASRAYMKHIGGPGAVLDGLSQDLIDEIETLREDIRRAEGGGGMCHFVTEVLQNRYGWERLFVSYLTANGEIICGGGHVVNILPDGSVLDPTRDQFGEGHSVSLVPAASDEIGRYRTEFYEDFHPRHPDAGDLLDGWADAFDGRTDAEVEDDMLAERGDGWWLADKTMLLAFQADMARHRSISPG
ncbi:hypothetical protein D3C71_157010 [compost metagenome]